MPAADDKPLDPTIHRSGLLLVGILLIAANLRPAITAVGPVLDTVRDQLPLSSGTASALVSVPLIAFALVSPVAPWVARRIGMERALGLGLAILAVGIVVRSVPWLPGLWIGTVLLGVAIAVLNVILPSLVKRDYPERIGQVTGVYSAVQAAMAAIAAGLAVPIAGITPSGWRLSLGIWAGLVLIAFAVFAPQLRGRSLPEDVVSPVPGVGARGYRSPWTSALAWQVTAYMGLQSTVFYLLITWLPSIEQSDGVSAATAGFHQLLLNAFGILGSLCVVWLVPRMKDQRLLAVISTLMLAGPIVGVLVDPGLDAIWISIGGLGSGVSFVLAITLFGLRTVNHGQTAALSGMAQSAGYLLAACGPIIIGVIHDQTGSWTPALVIILILLAGQFAAGLLAGRNRVIG
ncbi:MAG TPA: MFS transporter [Galbitalea sp.]|nr:MFS transporter [Galbitalea sp.]